MLRALTVRNYVLIERLDLRFGEGLSVVTGETGAGKSILLGALGLILGQRAASDVLRNSDDKCIVEGQFYISDYGLQEFFEVNELDYASEAILRREISPTGRSRAFINDTPVSLQLLRDLGEQLVDIHSQQRTGTIHMADVQLSLLDEFAGQRKRIMAYSDVYGVYRRKQEQLVQLRQKEEASRREKDYHQFLFDELSSADLEPGETAAIQEELTLLHNALDIRSALAFAGNALTEAEGNILHRLHEVKNKLKDASRHLPFLLELARRTESAAIELQDIAGEVMRLSLQVEPDPEREAQLSNRLSDILRLMKKHGTENEAGLIEARSLLQARLEESLIYEEEIARTESELAGLEKKIHSLGAEISQGRSEAIPALEKRVLAILAKVGMPDAGFQVQITPLDDCGPHGMEKARFLFNANRGGKPMELGQVASGGERSRLMLAIKSCITERKLLPTLILDEIDSGVSGEIASRVGEIMEDMGSRLQVIAITHLPQIAAKGKIHYLVSKELEGSSNVTRVRELDEDERIATIARMLSGQTVTAAASLAARDLLHENKE